MKELIIEALNNAFALLEKQVPQTKKKTEIVNIDDIGPLDIAQFMEINNIPKYAHFAGIPNGYDGFEGFGLAWDIDIPTTDEDKAKYRVKRFTGIAWQFIYKSLTNEGYKRNGFNSGLLKRFDDTTVFDMYINKDFDRLVEYYSLSFSKEEGQ